MNAEVVGLSPTVHHLSFHLFNTTFYQLGKELFLGKPAQAALLGQKLCPPVKPCVGAVLPVFFINAQKSCFF
jgi:hypothetical protein